MPRHDVKAYERDYHRVFTPDGADVIRSIRSYYDITDEFTSGEMISATCGDLGCVDSWVVLNALDHLMTLGELQEITAGQDVWGQHRRYRVLR